MSKVVFLSNVDRRFAMMQAALEQLRQENLLRILFASNFPMTLSGMTNGRSFFIMQIFCCLNGWAPVLIHPF